MHAGKFKLEKSTLAIGDVDGNGKREVLSIPAGETVELIADPSPENKVVDVLWEGRMVAMCTIDLTHKCLIKTFPCLRRERLSS